MSVAATTYNENMEAADQVEAEERIAGIIFDAGRERDEEGPFTRLEADRLAASVIALVFGSFPPGYQVQEDDFKRVKGDLRRAIIEKQGGESGRVLGEEDCAQLGRELLAVAIAFLRPDLVE